MLELKTKYLFIFSILSCFLLSACSESDIDSAYELNREKDFLENIDSEVPLYREGDKLFVKGELILYGYLKLTNDYYKEDFENGEADDDSFYNVSLVRDTSTGCIYIIDYGDGYSPYLNRKGEIAGCYENSFNSIEKDSNLSKLDIMKKYYPDKENTELEYMLESIFSGSDISENELILILDNIKNINTSKEDDLIDIDKSILKNKDSDKDSDKDSNKFLEEVFTNEK